MDDDNYTNQRIKYLEMIMGLIGRYTDGSARVKKLTIAFAGAIVLGFLGVFEIRNDISYIKIVLFGPIIIATSILPCWAFDLMCSRQAEFHREFYNMVRAQPCGQQPDFCMEPPSCITKGRSGFVGWKRTTPMFYGVLLVYSYLTILMFHWMLS